MALDRDSRPFTLYCLYVFEGNLVNVWAEVDLGILKENVDHLKEITTKEVFGVVKDNAYGHGDVEIARALDVKVLCVFSIREAIRLREHGVETDILIFGFTDISLIEENLHYNFIYTVASYTWFEKLQSPVRLHIEINTGMNRIGLKDLSEIQKIVDSNHSVEGIYTHFGNPTNIEIGTKQINAFTQLLSDIKHSFKWIHVGNAPVEIIKSNAYINAARFGLGMYGYREGIEGLKPILSLYAKLEFVDSANPKDTIGYDYTYEVTETLRYGTIPIGYSDGFDMRQSLCPVFIDGIAYPILGKVCMNQTMHKVSDATEIGSTVEIIGPNRSAQLIHETTGIMPYVLLTCLSPNIKRIYKKLSI